MRFEPLAKWTRPSRLRRRLSKQLPSEGSAHNLHFVLRSSNWRHVEFCRSGSKLTFRLATRDAFLDDRVHYYYRVFLPVVVFLLSRTNERVTHATAFIGDGKGVPDGSLAFSSNNERAHLIPDPEFFNSNGYQELREKLGNQRPWRERNDNIIWRGSISGKGRLPTDSGDLTAPDILPRVQMCALLASTPNTNVKIHQTSKSAAWDDHSEWLVRAGLVAERVPADLWIEQKFALDIDGETNAWSNLFTRLLFGCCVIKVDSQLGYRQWYYDQLAPWRTHVPVRSDLSDLHEKIEWCRTHSADCALIAKTGQDLARSMTWASETQKTIRKINCL
jgi:hypothetical protein